MRLNIFSFFIGICFLTTFAYLPNYLYSFVILFLLILSFIVIQSKKLFLSQQKYLLAMICFTAGFSYFNISAQYLLNHSLPIEYDNQTIIIHGKIADIPSFENQNTHFIFDIDKIISSQKNLKLKSYLSWFGQHELHQGDVLELKVKLKRPHGLSDPGAFDYEQWIFANKINTTGYVISQVNSHKNADSHLLQIRQKIFTKISEVLPNDPYTGIIQALVVGIKGQISEQQWQVLSRTGTNHLIVIAGLHIGIITTIFYFLVSFFWRRNKYLPLYKATPKAAMISAILGALFYAALAGFSIPTQRALIMLLVFMISFIWQRHLPFMQTLLLALFILLIVDPFIILSMSFWLSFAAVIIIIYGTAGRMYVNHHEIYTLGRIQICLAIGLLPLTLYYFDRASFVSFIANAIAIPIVGFLVEPLAILGGIFLLINDKIGLFFLFIADKLLHFLWPILSYLSALPWSNIQIAFPNKLILIVSFISILLLTAPKGMPSRWLAIIGISTIFLIKIPRPDIGQIEFTLLDVGQGLASVIQTKNHTLIYDTGPSYFSGDDAGLRIVMPYLLTHHIYIIDKLVVSHGDNDHIGGAQSIIKNFRVKQIETSVPARFPTQSAQYCLQGMHWQWDNVSFEYLYPNKTNLGLDNNSSCVLKITSGNHSILLTGDIEKSAEDILVEQVGANLKADILVAPHHGSVTSSSQDFIHLIDPIYVLFSDGYDNRYHFPNPLIVKRYQDLNTKSLNTISSGAITLMITPTGIKSTEEYRKQEKCFWNND